MKNAKGIKISFRINESEDKLIKLHSEKEGVSVSRYIRKCLFNEELHEKNVLIANWTQDIQQILNILEEYQIDDERIAKLAEELWSTILL